MPQRLHLPCKVRCLRLKPRGCDRALAFPVILKVHDRNHAARPDRAFDGGALCPPGISQNAGTISLMWDDLKTTERTSVDGPQKKDSGPTLAV
jgi:hypothetical protein